MKKSLVPCPLSLVPCVLGSLVFFCFLVPTPAAPGEQGTRDKGQGTDSVDFVFLGDLRPVLVRVHVEIDGKPHAQVWDEFLGKLFKYLDRDGNGTLSKEEAERAPVPQQLFRILQGVSFYDEQFVPNGRRGNVTAKMADLDLNKDGKVTPDELKAYYKVKSLGYQPVSLSMGGTGGDSQALTDALFKHLDTNKDGKLSKEELAAAPERLRKLDTDDDEMISVAELVPNRFGGEEGFAVPVFGGDAAPPTLPDNAPLVRVEGAAPNEKLGRRLLSQYDKDRNGKLSPKEIGLGVAEFAALDKNKDGQLDLSELSAFGARPADLGLIYRLGKLPKGKAPGGLLKLVTDARGSGGEALRPASLFGPDDRPQPLAGAVTKLTGGGLKLGLPDAHIDFQAAQSTAMNDAGVKQFYLQQFKEADVNKKGYLERKVLENTQFQYLLPLFGLADRNGDNKLTEKELSDFLDLQSEGSACVVTLTAHDLGRGLFELIDVAPRDGRLGLRELRTAWSRLAPLDRDGDGAVAKNEVPRQMQLSVRQSGLGYPYQFVGAEIGYRSQMPVPAPTRGPLWFRKMDRNADGDVSAREWLGTEEEFRKIDTDGDGLISAEEAERYDALLKKQAKP
ncbi:MAG TPA: EF-hand domain-containing protein [Gemmataceae bacterium]|nr:EF-hand domain-containing protein [Gemmataceae bacterium]